MTLIYLNLKMKIIVYKKNIVKDMVERYQQHRFHLQKMILINLLTINNQNKKKNY